MTITLSALMAGALGFLTILWVRADEAAAIERAAMQRMAKGMPPPDPPALIQPSMHVLISGPATEDNPHPYQELIDGARASGIAYVDLLAQIEHMQTNGEHITDRCPACTADPQEDA